jgi:1,4-alpha-glucan branching enzyme
VSDNGITYREWAPNAKELKLNEYSCTTDNGGNWEVFIPKDDDDNH